jgi:hypothetical protein
MAYWQAANAKAKFGALLDAAEQEGPQLIHRRKLKFVATTEEEIERRLAEAARESGPNSSVPGTRCGRRPTADSTWTSLG